MSKPNCYECKWRGTLPGDAHSCCKAVLDDPGFMGLGAKMKKTAVKPEVSGNPHGIKMG